MIAVCLALAGACRARDSQPQPARPTEPPARIVALTPSLVEITFALGLGPRVVGVSSFANYPPEAAKLAKVGDFLQPSIERIASLRPDLVLLDAVQVSPAAALRAAGIRSLALPIESIEDVRRAIRAVGAATGAETRAAQLLRELDADLAAASVRAEGRPRPRVLFAVDRELGSLRNLVCAGPSTYLDELIRRAGGDNVLADAKLRFLRVAPEEILARAPTVILDAVHTRDVQRARADWQALATVPAVARGRVYVLADPAFVTPGPRLGQMLKRLAEMLHPGAADAGAGGAAAPPSKAEPQAGDLTNDSP
ncbi:MAG TPA: helical backbone metal receptor [Polyangia bacterium]